MCDFYNIEALKWDIDYRGNRLNQYESPDLTTHWASELTLFPSRSLASSGPTKKINLYLITFTYTNYYLTIRSLSPPHWPHSVFCSNHLVMTF